LRQSLELTEGLQNETFALDQEVQRLKAENVRLRGQLAELSTRDGAVVPGAERDRQSTGLGMLERTRAVQAGGRATELEQELNIRASLHVASAQLSGTLSLGRVVKHMCELLEQLVGAQSFAIYVLSADGTRGLPVGFRGLSHPPAISVEDGVVGDVCLTGVARVLEPEEQRNPNEPIAVLPLRFDSEVVGVIAVHRLLPHKRGWEEVDRELYRLLSVQGAVALIAANQYAKVVGPRAALHDVIVHLENERLRQLTEAESEMGGDV
jgi:hypothetical protein